MNNYDAGNRAIPDLSNPDRPPIDPERALRAASLTVVPLEGMRDLYQVEGESEFYNVALSPHFSCDCGDASFRETICKHLIAVLAYRGDPEARSLMSGKPYERLTRSAAASVENRWRAEFRAQLRAISAEADGQRTSADRDAGTERAEPVDPFAAFDV